MKCPSTPNDRYNSSGKQTKAVRNNTRGTIAQNRIMKKWENKGWQIQRYGARKHGVDFIAYRYGRRGQIFRFIEVKVNNAVLTDHQKKQQAKIGARYIVERVKMPTATTCRTGRKK